MEPEQGHHHGHHHHRPHRLHFHHHHHRNKNGDGLLQTPNPGASSSSSSSPPATPLSLTWYSPMPLAEEDFADNGRGGMDILPYEDQGPHGFARQWLLYEHRGWHVGRKLTIVPLSVRFPHPWKRAGRVARGDDGAGDRVGRIAGVEASVGGEGDSNNNNNNNNSMKSKKKKKDAKGKGKGKGMGGDPVMELIDPKRSAFAHAVRKPMTMPLTGRPVLASAVRSRVRPEWRDASLVLFSGPSEDAAAAAGGPGGALKPAADGLSFYVFFVDGSAGSGAGAGGGGLPQWSTPPPAVATRVYDDATGVMTGMQFEVPISDSDERRNILSINGPGSRHNHHDDDNEASPGGAPTSPAPAVDTFVWRYTNNLGLSTQSLSDRNLRPGQHCGGGCLRFVGNHPQPQPTFSLLHRESGHEVAFFSKSHHGGDDGYGGGGRGRGRGGQPSTYITGLHTTWMNFRWTEWATAKMTVTEEARVRVRARRGERIRATAANPAVGATTADGKLTVPGGGGGFGGFGGGNFNGGSHTAAAAWAADARIQTDSGGEVREAGKEEEEEEGEEEQWDETTIDRTVEKNLSRQAAYTAVLTAMAMAMNIMPCPEDAYHGHHHHHHHHAKHRRGDGPRPAEEGVTPLGYAFMKEQ